MVADCWKHPNRTPFSFGLGLEDHCGGGAALHMNLALQYANGKSHLYQAIR